ncbi:unnamed protein product [Leptidea sinapis]|uniref:Uncharacterized protein n=1 Tax=Leptidea sinapis TaxID=189913 RepID=A0A5E4QN25_9NEOP|nr:unnamed protein product [Leptidea sinapis]
MFYQHLQDCEADVASFNWGLQPSVKSQGSTCPLQII